jgi:hypothetical protein
MNHSVKSAGNLKWLQIRKDLYRHIEAQVRYRLGSDTPGLQAYKASYEKEFSGKWQAVTNSAFLDKLRESKVFFVGDFHSHQQSQKAQLRILKNLNPIGELVLAVEFLEADHQDQIDKYLRGKLSEREFLKSIKWAARWGFPWEHYRPIMRYAQSNKIKVIGLNKYVERRNANSLRSRDVYAAQKLAELIGRQPQAQVMVIFGDLHLAKEHLPQELLKRVKSLRADEVCRVFQNVESIYFQLLKRGLEASVDVVKLRANDFCLQSVPPWVKWQNYLMFLENNYDLEIDDEDDDISVDYGDHVGRFLSVIETDLSIKVSHDHLAVVTAEEGQLWGKLREKFKEAQLKNFEILIEASQSFYIPEIEVAYLARPTVNHLGSLAMLYMQAQASKRMRSIGKPHEQFNKLIWLECLSYFGSKIINPKRKTDTVQDIRLSLVSRSAVIEAKEPLQLALAQKMIELQWQSGGRKKRTDFTAKNKASYFEAARLLGGILGEKLYTGHIKGLVGLPLIQKWLSTSMDDIDFDSFYFETVEVIDHLPINFKSKREKM